MILFGLVLAVINGDETAIMGMCVGAAFPIALLASSIEKDYLDYPTWAYKNRNAESKKDVYTQPKLLLILGRLFS